MEQRTYAVRAWMISVIIHVLIFVLVVPGGGQSAGTGTLLEVDLAEMTGTNPAVAAAALASEDQTESPQAEPEEALDGDPLPPIPEGPSTETNAEKKEETEAQAKTESTANPPGSVVAPTAGSGSGTGRGPGYGSGAGFVLSGPLYYPKNVQNEGVEGRVRLAVFLGSTGQVKAEIIESSGDQRLDNYSLRAVTEAWRYRPAPEPLRIMMSLTFRDGKVNIDFEGSEPWNGEESQP